MEGLRHSEAREAGDFDGVMSVLCPSERGYRICRIFFVSRARISLPLRMHSVLLRCSDGHTVSFDRDLLFSLSPDVVGAMLGEETAADPQLPLTVDDLSSDWVMLQEYVRCADPREATTWVSELNREVGWSLHQHNYKRRRMRSPFTASPTSTI